MSDQNTNVPVPPSMAPYLLRAMWGWITDQNHTPLIIVNTAVEGVDVPKHVIDANGMVTLNIADRSVKFLKIDNDSISFGAAFGGRHYNVHVPMVAIMAIYSRETTTGFSLESYHPKKSEAKDAVGFKPPSLAVVSNSPPSESPAEVIERVGEVLGTASSDADAQAPMGQTPRRRGHLTVVK